MTVYQKVIETQTDDPYATHKDVEKRFAKFGTTRRFLMLANGRTLVRVTEPVDTTWTPVPLPSEGEERVFFARIVPSVRTNRKERYLTGAEERTEWFKKKMATNGLAVTDIAMVRPVLYKINKPSNRHSKTALDITFTATVNDAVSVKNLLENGCGEGRYIGLGFIGMKD